MENLALYIKVFWMLCGFINAAIVFAVVMDGKNVVETFIACVVAFISGIAGFLVIMYFFVLPMVIQRLRKETFSQQVHNRRARRTREAQ